MGAPRSDRGGGVGRWRLAIAIFATLVFLMGQVGPAAADPGDQQRLAELQQQKDQLARAVDVSRQNAERYRQQAEQYQSAVQAANARIADLASQEAAAQDQAQILSIQIEITQEQLALVAFQMTETQALVDSLKAEAAQQAAQLTRREELYGLHLRTTYREAQVSPLEMLLSSSSLADFVTRVRAFELIDREDRELVAEIRSLKASTAAKQAEVAQREKEIVGLQGQVEKQKAALAKEKADYESVAQARATSIGQEAALRATQADLRNQASTAKQQADQQTADLQKRLAAAQAAYEELAAQLAAGSGLAVFTGRLVLWPLNGVITQGFGPTPFTGEPSAWYGGVWYPHFHNGIDIAAPMYTPIRAPAAGRVVTVGKPYISWGDTAEIVIIAHGQNFSTLYGHLDDSVRPPPVHVGEWVRAGQIVGYEGMTGWTTGPHLHFMTIVNGHAVDPMAYLPAR